MSRSATALLAASHRLLRPLVRVLMRSGITFPVLAEVLRRLFMEVALGEVLTQPRARTDSRVSLLTGIHRKEIRRIRGMPANHMVAPEIVTLGSQIIARWLGSPRFADASGRPLVLPRMASPGVEGPSFDELVSSVTADIRSRAVLDEFLAQGLIRVEPGDCVALNNEAFIPKPGGEEHLFYFARNLHDHLAAAVANISARDAAPFLDRSVHYDELTAEQARELESFARSAAMQALLEVNRKALELVEGSVDPSDQPRHRVNFGIFIFGEDEATAGYHSVQAGGAAA